jgi:dihydrofolate reductase
MNKSKISIVVAVAEKTRAIGKGNELLFRISDDLKRFKAITKGHPVIMGRKTYESIGRALPERQNIIVTRERNYDAPGAEIAHSLEEALALADKRGYEDTQMHADKEKEFLVDEVFIIGGGEIFKQALPITDKIYLTIVESDATGDVFFPDWRSDFTKETFREERFDEKTRLKYVWVDLEREK